MDITILRCCLFFFSQSHQKVMVDSFFIACRPCRGSVAQFWGGSRCLVWLSDETGWKDNSIAKCRMVSAVHNGEGFFQTPDPAHGLGFGAIKLLTSTTSWGIKAVLCKTGKAYSQCSDLLFRNSWRIDLLNSFPACFAALVLLPGRRGLGGGPRHHLKYHQWVPVPLVVKHCPKYQRCPLSLSPTCALLNKASGCWKENTELNLDLSNEMVCIFSWHVEMLLAVHNLPVKKQMIYLLLHGTLRTMAGEGAPLACLLL